MSLSLPPSLSEQATASIIQSLAHIKLLVMDVDGVLTDGRLWYGANGEELKVFDAHDGHGLVHLFHKAQFKLAIISGRKHPAVEKRAEELNIHHVFQKVFDKKKVLADLLHLLNLKSAQCCVIGDDIPDISMFSEAGLSVAVADAVDGVLAAADLITQNKGGRGAVRELCDFLIAHR